MNQKLNLIAAFAAGLFGSGIMHYISSAPVLAQDQTPVTKEIRAQNFTLVDASNAVIGTFTTDPPAGLQARANVKVPSHVILRDQNGRVIWTADSGTKFLPLTTK